MLVELVAQALQVELVELEGQEVVQTPVRVQVKEMVVPVELEVKVEMVEKAETVVPV